MWRGMVMLSLLCGVAPVQAQTGSVPTAADWKRSVPVTRRLSVDTITLSPARIIVTAWEQFGVSVSTEGGGPSLVHALTDSALTAWTIRTFDHLENAAAGRPSSPAWSDDHREGAPPFEDGILIGYVPSARVDSLAQLSFVLRDEARHQSVVVSVSQAEVERLMAAFMKAHDAFRGEAATCAIAPKMVGPLPSFPNGERSRQREGQVLLALAIRADGTASVDESVVMFASDPLFADHALRWAPRARLLPARTADGQPCASRAVLPLNFAANPTVPEPGVYRVVRAR